MDGDLSKCPGKATFVAVFGFTIFSLFFHLYNTNNVHDDLTIILYGQIILGISMFASFFIFDGLLAVFVRSVFLSIMLSLHYYAPCSLNYFIIIVSCFHLGTLLK